MVLEDFGLWAACRGDRPAPTWTPQSTWALVISGKLTGWPSRELPPWAPAGTCAWGWSCLKTLSPPLFRPHQVSLALHTDTAPSENENSFILPQARARRNLDPTHFSDEDVYSMGNRRETPPHTLVPWANREHIKPSWKLTSTYIGQGGKVLILKICQ